MVMRIEETEERVFQMLETASEEVSKVNRLVKNYSSPEGVNDEALHKALRRELRCYEVQFFNALIDLAYLHEKMQLGTFDYNELNATFEFRWCTLMYNINEFEKHVKSVIIPKVERSDREKVWR